MSKRTNPFIDDFLPQSKIHVGVKQFNNNHDRLKKVFEKTLDLLYKGAKKSSAPDTFNNNDINFNKKEDKMRQLFIGKDGSLLHSGNMMQHNTSLKSCKCENNVEYQCAYCEISLCALCQHICKRCQNTYCISCVIDGSEGPEICMSCYG